eukprot:SAG25_NODE_3094_length_1222_cov_0.593945_2_plen_88_part_00
MIFSAHTLADIDRLAHFPSASLPLCLSEMLIVGSGARHTSPPIMIIPRYNRSLTPFGFQSEQRSYWEATSLYRYRLRNSSTATGILD